MKFTARSTQDMLYKTRRGALNRAKKITQATKREAFVLWNDVTGQYLVNGDFLAQVGDWVDNVEQWFIVNRLKEGVTDAASCCMLPVNLARATSDFEGSTPRMQEIYKKIGDMFGLSTIGIIQYDLDNRITRKEDGSWERTQLFAQFDGTWKSVVVATGIHRGL